MPALWFIMTFSDWKGLLTFQMLVVIFSYDIMSVHSRMTADLEHKIGTECTSIKVWDSLKMLCMKMNQNVTSQSITNIIAYHVHLIFLGYIFCSFLMLEIRQGSKPKGYSLLWMSVKFWKTSYLSEASQTC